MALRQVFVSTDADLQAASAPDYFTDLSSGVVGIWNHAGATGTGAWHTSALYQNAIDTDAEANDASTGLTTISQSIPLVASFQIAMGYGSGNPIGSPIIRSSDLIDITYTEYNAAAKEVVDFDVSGESVSTGDVATVKIQVRYTGEPSTYDAQINPSGETIGNAFSQIVEQSQKVFNAEFVIGSTATAAAMVDGLVLAINAHGVLKELVTASNNSNDLRLTSKINGLHVVGQFLVNGTKVKTSAVSTVGQMGAGNYYQVIGEEKKSRLANAGNFNRLYLPDTVTTFAASGTNYDRISIRYANRLPAHVFGGGQPSVSECVIYYPNDTGSNNDFDVAFPHTEGTNSIARFSGALGSSTALNL